MTPWTFHTAPSVESQAAGAIDAEWEEAQAWCNFVLLRPTALPGDVELVRSGVRPEAPPGRAARADPTPRPTWTQSNRAVHRAEFSGRGRRLRIKQFLYDYAPPAFDHPSLWESENVHPFTAGSVIGWLGDDFRGLRAAAICVDRTTVELSVTEGAFEDEELQAICRGLRPAAPEARERILSTPFADLCYQGRHQEPPIAVPVGYWAHKRLPESLRVTVLRAEQVPKGARCFGVSPPGEYGYRLNTAFVFGDPGRLQETDSLYEHEEEPGRYVRVLVSPSDAEGGVPYPPAREARQQCSSRVLSFRNTDVYHAYCDWRYGQHEAVWRKGGLNVMLIVKPTPWTDLAWFDCLLEEMV